MKDLLTTLKEYNIHISLQKDDLKVKFNGVLPENLINEIRKNKEALIHYLKQQVAQHADHRDIQKIADDPGGYPVSSSQRRLWILSQFGESNAAYNMPGAYVLEGELDLDSLQYSFDQLIERHEILRTVFKENEQGEPRQFVNSAAHSGFLLTVKEFNASAQQPSSLNDIINSDAGAPFDLSAGPLIRATVYALGENKWLLSCVMHHIISDGWSLGIMIKELLMLYNARLTGGQYPLAPLRIQYRDYAAWQQEQLTGEQLQVHKSYWLDQFKGELPLLEFPAAKVRPPVRNYDGGVIHTKISPGTTLNLKSFTRNQEGTLFMGLLTAINILLFRYTGQEDIIIGSPIAGREHPDLEEQIGCYLNTLALRTSFSGDDSFGQLLEKVRQVTLRAYEHQVYPFDELIGELNLQRDISRNPLFDVMVVLHNSDVTNSGGLAKTFSNLKVSPYAGEERPFSKFDLVFSFVETPGGMNMSIEYNSYLYTRASILRLADNFDRLLEACLDFPDKPVCELEYINDREKKRLLEDFNDTQFEYPKDKTLMHLFEAHAEKFPDKTALVFRNERWSFRELNEKANRLGYYLQRHYTIGREDVVGVKLERSVEMIISILGILKSGAAYLPIDPDYPLERIGYMIRDSACKVVIDKNQIGKFQKEERDYSGNNLPLQGNSSDLAYVIYTSGSTGEPKGCMLEHKGVVNRIQWMYSHYGFTSGDIILQKTNYTFDVSVWEIFLPLCWGGQMVLCEKDDARSPERIAGLIQKHGVTCLHFVPGMLSAFISSLFDSASELDSIRSLKRVITSGEALPVEMVKKWYEKLDVVIHNLYGPTEASVDVTYFETSRQNEVIPIGRPIWNTRIYVLDKNNRLVPVGVPGEICIGGDGLARGYLNKPGLTAEKFIPDPYKEGERIYKTGDLGRWLESGDVEFIGRKDSQVKIRGYRIELGEVESVLGKHEAVESCIAAAVRVSSAEKDIVAYVVPDNSSAFTIRRIMEQRDLRLPPRAALYELPDGLSFYSYNKSELQFLHEEIFGDNVYLKHGITISPGACVIDVGANLGMFTVFAGMQAKGVKVFSFEPMPPVFELLKLNASLYPHAELFNIGLSDKEEEAVFTYYPNATVLSGRSTGEEAVAGTVRAFMQNTIKDSLDEATKEEVDDMLHSRLVKEQFQCKLKSLSQVIREQKIHTIDLLKVDVEGGELDVLLGINEEDWKKIRQIVIEVHDIDGRLERIKTMLQSKNFFVKTDQSTELAGTVLYDLYAISPGQESSLPDAAAIGNTRGFCGVNQLKSELRKFLKKQLPEFMVPADFVFLPQLPLNANGKVDRKALPSLLQANQSQKLDHVAPRNELEKTLAVLWSEILGKENISVNTSFFDLGGHSLKASRLASRIHKTFGVKPELQDLFTAVTIDEQARLISESQKAGYAAIPPAGKAAGYPLSSSQQRLWLLSQFEGVNAAYNIPGILVFEGQLELKSLRFAFERMIERHEMLRTVFRENEEGEAAQYILDSREAGFQLQVHDLRSETERENRLDMLLQLDTGNPFDLAKGPLLRASVYRTGEDRWVFSYAMHHIISDGWSIQIMIDELIRFYNAHVKGESVALPELRIQYKDYAVWQQARLKGQLREHRAYWVKQLALPLPVLDLPAGKFRPGIKTYRGGVVTRRLGHSASNKLRLIAASENGTLFMSLLAALNALMYSYTSLQDIVIGTPIAGREHVDLENQIGFYVNTLALRTRFSHADSFMGLFAKVREVTFGAYEHQQYPFDELVNDLKVPRSNSRGAIFDIMIVLQNTDINNAAQIQEMSNVRVSAYEGLNRYASKFDMTFYFMEEGEEINMVIAYNQDIYGEEYMNRLSDRYVRICGLAESDNSLSLQAIKTKVTEDQSEYNVFLNQLTSPLSDKF